MPLSPCTPTQLLFLGHHFLNNCNQSLQTFVFFFSPFIVIISHGVDLLPNIYCFRCWEGAMGETRPFPWVYVPVGETVKGTGDMNKAISAVRDLGRRLKGKWAGEKVGGLGGEGLPKEATLDQKFEWQEKASPMKSWARRVTGGCYGCKGLREQYPQPEDQRGGYWVWTERLRAWSPGQGGGGKNGQSDHLWPPG